jgi:dolichyl-diphosphooligosaccharide--protein glycosyltransferase
MASETETKKAEVTAKGLFRRPEISRKSILIALALVAIFASALIMRVYPARYGYYLNEFDPFFDYYATNFIVNSFDHKGFAGLADYFSWTDYKTWYPEGRPVARTSQVGLHFAGALTYLVVRGFFGSAVSLYDYLVMFPPVFGALTTLMVFLLVRRIAGAGGGLLASLVIAVSTPIIARGNLGWFKSEPFALFLTTAGAYLFLTIYDSNIKFRGFLIRAVLAGFLLGYANTAWGGSLYFGAVFGVLLLLAPFLGVDQRRTVIGGTIFVAINLLSSAMFPRPGPSIVTNPSGLALLAGLGFSILAYVIKSASDPRDYRKALSRTVLAVVLGALAFVSFGLVSGISGRYQTVLYPFQRTGNPLVESVAEHFIPTGAEYFDAYYILLFLGGFGAFTLFRRRNLPSAFALVLGISSIYIASSFSRLMVFSSIAYAILAGVGFAEVTSAIFRPAVAGTAKKKSIVFSVRPEMKAIYAIFMIAILAFPVVAPASANEIRGSWVRAADTPVSIANAGTGYRTERADWFEALTWIKENTPQNAVLAAWWDYGYWITVMGNRTSLADNATINSTRIATLARMFMSPEREGIEIAKSLHADYILIFVAGQKSEEQNLGQVYILGGGGEESKKQWFIRIGGFDQNVYLYEDEFTPKPALWDNSLLGKLMPFKLNNYIDADGRLVGGDWERGRNALYNYQMNYPADGEGPLILAFESSSIKKDARAGIFTGVLIYKINKDYKFP